MSVEVFAIGRTNVDVCVHSEEMPRTGQHRIADEGCMSSGGSAANFAAQMARLGVKVGLISCVGNDLYGQSMLKNLSQIGVDTRPVLQLENQSTGIFLSITDKTGRRMTVVHPGANRFLERYVVDEALLVRASTIHMAGGFPMMTERVAKIASVNGIIFSFDPGRTAQEVDFQRILARTDLLFVNERELKEYVRVRANERDLKAFAKTFPGVVIVKLGERGAVATDGFEFYQSSAFPVDVVDTLGAGDAFAAGFVTAWTRFENIETALHMANAVAALTVRKRGAQNGQPTMEDVAAFLASHNVSIEPVLRTFRKRVRKRKR